ncbi:hypothetical protein HDU85_004943 [Gaertneriomyces sp. JEL0708]|nr:hypothetical protein HDU85_004943 [Gaertneriomyces sp. JEL0708]
MSEIRSRLHSRTDSQELSHIPRTALSRDRSVDSLDSFVPRSSSIVDLSQEKALVDVDPIAAIRALRAKIRAPPPPNEELEQLEHQLAEERQRKKEEREERAKGALQQHLERRATISTWNRNVNDSISKLKQWQQESSLRLKMRELEHEHDRKQYISERKRQQEKKRRSRTLKRKPVSTVFCYACSPFLNGG